MWRRQFQARWLCRSTAISCETLASGTGLFAVYRSTYSDDVDARDVAEYQLDQSELWLRRADAFRRSADAAGVHLVDIDYRQLIADTPGCLSMVYAAAGMEPPPDLDGFIAGYRHAHPAHGGAHRYAFEEFGIDPAAVRERFSSLVPE